MAWLGRFCSFGGLWEWSVLGPYQHTVQSSAQCLGHGAWPVFVEQKNKWALIICSVPGTLLQQCRVTWAWPRPLTCVQEVEFYEDGNENHSRDRALERPFVLGFFKYACGFHGNLKTHSLSSETSCEGKWINRKESLRRRWGAASGSNSSLPAEKACSRPPAAQNVSLQKAGLASLKSSTTPPQGQATKVVFLL